MAPAPPGSGSLPLNLDTPAFFALIGTLVLFVAMLLVLRTYYPNRKRGFEGYLDAAGVSLAFLVFSVALVVVLAVDYPYGNRTAWAFFETVLEGYWLAFAIPVVTVGSSIQARSRGAIRWLLPSVGIAVLMFFVMAAYYFAVGG